MTTVLQVLGRSAGGIARHVGQLVSSLDARDDLRVDVAGPPDLPVPLPKPSLPLTIPDGVTGGHRAAIALLRKYIEDGGYDVVHAHGLRAGIDAAVASRPTEARIVTTVHNVVTSAVVGARAALYRPAEPLAVYLSARTFAVSEDIARRLRGTAPGAADKVEVLYLGIGDAPAVAMHRGEVRRALGVTPHRRLIVTAARLSPQKAVDVLLRAVAVSQDRPHLAILGRGPLERDLKELATQLGIADRVGWVGWTKDAASYIAAADVFCLSSVWEGVPLAAQEAILLGTPVVATAVGGMPELIADRVSGRLVRARDPGALADALHEVLGSEDDRARYARAARAALRTRFSTPAMLARLRAEYRNRDGG